MLVSVLKKSFKQKSTQLPSRLTTRSQLKARAGSEPCTAPTGVVDAVWAKEGVTPPPEDW